MADNSSGKDSNGNDHAHNGDDHDDYEDRDDGHDYDGVVLYIWP